MTRRAPSAGGWAGITIAFGGLLLLTGAATSGLRLGSGEILTLLGTVAITAEILLIGHFAGTVDTRRVTVVQLAVCALLAFTACPIAGEPLPTPSWTLAAIVGCLGVASAVIQVTMNWAQRSVSPTRATVIYAGEPVWAALLGRLAGERLTTASLTGGALIVVAVLISDLGVRGLRAEKGTRHDSPANDLTQTPSSRPADTRSAVSVGATRLSDALNCREECLRPGDEEL